MMNSENINITNLENVLKNYIKPKEKLVKYVSSPLTGEGAHYGSILSGLKIIVKNEDTGEERGTEAVAKLMIDDDFCQELFKWNVAFSNEIGFYSIIVPTLQEFLRKNDFNAVNLDFLPVCFGCRNFTLSLDKVDKNAILILENLKSTGFTIGNRTEGYDYDTTKMILNTLAKFHTITLTLKIKEPETFENKIRPYLVDLDYRYHPDVFNMVVSQLSYILPTDPVCSKYSKLALKTANLKFGNKIVSEKWATIMHNDIWITNIMLKHDENKRVTEVKLIDFQACEYKSCLRDLLMFLFTSVSESLLEKHLDEFLDFYHAKFVEYLEKFGIDTKDYSRSEFYEQLKTDARESEYYHIVSAINVTVPQEVEMSITEILEMRNSGKIGNVHKEKLRFITKEFGERGWLY